MLNGRYYSLGRLLPRSCFQENYNNNSMRPNPHVGVRLGRYDGWDGGGGYEL